MKTSNPYGFNFPVKFPPETITSERAKEGGKAKARYPDKPISNIPGGSTRTSGPFRRALTPGTSPAGS